MKALLFLPLFSLPFWIFLSVVAAAIIAEIEHELWGWATVTLAGTFVALWAFGGFNLLLLALHDPVRALVVLGVYFVVGGLWSVVKWWRFLVHRRDLFLAFRERFLSYNGLPPGSKIPPEKKKLFIDRANTELWSNGVQRTPSPSDHKAAIIGWMAYWPLSLLWVLISDPVRKGFEWVYESLTHVYDLIAKKVYAGVADDMSEPPPGPPTVLTS